MTEAAASAPGTRAAIEIGESVTDERWDAFVSSRPDASAYHYAGWPRLIERAFGHERRMLAALSGGTVVGVLPLVVMRSRLFGTHVISLPYVNRGGILAASGEARAALLAAAVEIARARSARYLELRHLERIYPDLVERRHKVAMSLALESTRDAQWQAIDRKVRNQVRKGEKSALVSADGGLELVPAFYDVFARNMRDLGTPVFPRRLFEELLRTFPDHSRVVCVSHEGRAVAAAIVHWRGDWMEVPWASTVREANALAANMFLYWQLLGCAIERGCRVFEFGRCTPGEGTFHFKRQWGATASPLVWEYWTPDANATVGLDQKSGGLSRAVAIWRKLPLGVTTRLGPHVVRGIPC